MPGLPAYRVVESCRVCGERDLAPVVSLGETPLANAFVRPERAAAPEPRFPLAALRCRTCGLVQLSVVVRPELMFTDYLYVSSASAPMVEHFDGYAAEVVERFAPAGSLVVEVGSNDGILLRPLAARGARAIGVEPAGNLAAAASAAGLETWNDFFGPEVAGRLVQAKGRASAVLANNVLAHIDDLAGVLRALDLLLAPDGVFVAEVPYLGDLLDRVEYDTIYHEHLSYFALAPLEALFARAGMELFDVRHLAVHGGSIRAYAGRRGHHPVTAELGRVREAEAHAGLGEQGTYDRFAGRVTASRAALRGLLGGLRGEGKCLAGLGASAKGNTLLNYCGIGTETLSFIADSTPQKQGLLTPGTHIPVRPEAALLAERPDYTLLLAWNFADAIARRHAAYVVAGGRFIHPVPLARVLS